MKGSILLVLALVASLVVPAQTELDLVSDVWPPFTNVEGENAFAKMLVDQALERSDIKTTTTITDFKEVLDGIQEGRFDGSAALWYSEDRAEYLLFSEPYMENRLVLVGAKGADVSAAQLSELQGKKIGIVGDYAYGDVLTAENSPVFVSGSSDQDDLEKLLSGTVDYILVDDLLIQYILTYQGEEAKEYLEIGTNAMITRALFFAVRKDLENAENIISGFNAEINNMIADGTYNTILDLNWIRHDVDGDGKMELVYSGGGEPTSGGYAVFQNPNDDPHDGYWVNGKKYYDWNDVPEEERMEQNYHEALVDERFTYKLKFK